MSVRMAAVDAQFYWTSAKVPSDEFMLYAFAGEPTDFERAVAPFQHHVVQNRASNHMGFGMLPASISSATRLNSA